MDLNEGKNLICWNFPFDQFTSLLDTYLFFVHKCFEFSRWRCTIMCWTIPKQSPFLAIKRSPTHMFPQCCPHLQSFCFVNKLSSSVTKIQWEDMDSLNWNIQVFTRDSWKFGYLRWCQSPSLFLGSAFALVFTPAVLSSGYNLMTT